jgi:AraC-like DNA-binding protein
MRKAGSSPESVQERAPRRDHRFPRPQIHQADVRKPGAEIELDSIARESGLSRPHFYRLFRTQTGVTPHLYLNTLMMEQALDALVATEAPIADIGFDLGFSSQSGFTRFFAANVGMAPTEYRRVAKVLRP